MLEKEIYYVLKMQEHIALACQAIIIVELNLLRPVYGKTNL
jgi:hypothetical protein